MHRQLVISIALCAHAVLAAAQSQQPAPTPLTPSELFAKFPAPPVPRPLLSPEQQEAAKAAREAQRLEYERKLDERFVVKGNEVYDKKADRTWQRCNYGQTWDEESRWCKGVAKRTTVDAATAEVAKSGGGWRVPDAGEMMSLFEVACRNAKKQDSSAPIFPEVIPMTFYLTSTAHGDSDHNTATECLGSTASLAGLGRKYVSVLRLVRDGSDGLTTSR